MSDLYLTDDELQDHTGLKQPAAQRKRLEASGLRKDVHFFERADGKRLELELTSMISWRGEWYVVHLNGFE